MTKSPTLALLATAFTLIAASTAATAGPSCNEAQDKWMKEDAFKAQIEGQGYKIKTFKISSGKCYEIYGYDKAGKKVEIYYNPVTAAVVETK